MSDQESITLGWKAIALDGNTYGNYIYIYDEELDTVLEAQALLLENAAKTSKEVNSPFKSVSIIKHKWPKPDSEKVQEFIDCLEEPSNLCRYEYTDENGNIQRGFRVIERKSFNPLDQ